MNSQARDQGIPVLTEVIEPRSETDDGTEHIAEQQLVSADAVTSAAAPFLRTADVKDVASTGVAPMGREEWNRMEQALRDTIVQQLSARVDGMLEMHVRDTLADVLQGAVDKLADEIRDGLQRSLHEMVATAVAQEVQQARMRKS